MSCRFLSLIFLLIVTPVHLPGRSCSRASADLTGTGIPTLNIYGLIALALLLVGTGLLLYRKPQRT